MHKFSDIYINDYGLLNNFLFEAHPSDEKLSLYLLMGKNGSGKSTFMDALYNIAGNQKTPDTLPFSFRLIEENKIKLGNVDFEGNKNNSVQETNVWKKVIRFYTGHTSRNANYTDSDYETYFSFDVNSIKYVLTSLCLSGKWSAAENKDIIDEISRSVFLEKGMLVPVSVYLNIKNYNEDTFEIKDVPFVTDPIVEAGITKLSLDLSEKINNNSSFAILHTLMMHINVSENQIVDTGFLYKKLEANKPDELLGDNTLSDGELGLIQRMSLILLMKELSSPEQSSLLLLDEPETHFNEMWKRNFIYLVKKILSHTYHDVFIATHSSILATDAKSSELYKFELKNEKIKVVDIPVKLYGSNVSDVANILFNIEGDAGRSSTEEIENLLNSNSKKDIEKIKSLLAEVGPGEYRWRLRAKLQELMSQKKVTVPVCPLVRKRRKHA